MTAKQISVFLQNQPGKLADFCASALCEVHKRFSIEGGEIHSVKEGIQILHG